MSNQQTESHTVWPCGSRQGDEESGARRGWCRRIGSCRHWRLSGNVYTWRQHGMTARSPRYSRLVGPGKCLQAESTVAPPRLGVLWSLVRMSTKHTTRWLHWPCNEVERRVITNQGRDVT